MANEDKPRQKQGGQRKNMLRVQDWRVERGKIVNKEVKSDTLDAQESYGRQVKKDSQRGLGKFN